VKVQCCAELTSCMGISGCIQCAESKTACLMADPSALALTTCLVQQCDAQCVGGSLDSNGGVGDGGIVNGSSSSGGTSSGGGTSGTGGAGATSSSGLAAGGQGNGKAGCAIGSSDGSSLTWGALAVGASLLRARRRRR
jgi:hypothetical protein